MKRKKGFTYMEVIVTMLVIIALSLLSYPIYTGRKSSTKPALAEGYTLLGYIVNAQIAYFNEYGNFLSQANGGNKVYYHVGESIHNYSSVNNVLGINAINNRYFSFFNAFGVNTNDPSNSNYRYRFKAFVMSKDYGTISLEYNLTQRFEPVVSGV